MLLACYFCEANANVANQIFGIIPLFLPTPPRPLPGGDAAVHGRGRPLQPGGAAPHSQAAGRRQRRGHRGQRERGGERPPQAPDHHSITVPAQSHPCAFYTSFVAKIHVKKVVLVPQIITGSKPPLAHMEASHDIEAPVSHDIIAPVSHDIKAPDQTVYTSYSSYSCRYLDQVRVDSQTLPSGC